MKTHGLSRALVLSLLSVSASLFVATGPIQAQVAFRPTRTVVSTSTINVAGTATANQTGLKETVNFSGPVEVTATVLIERGRPVSLVVAINGRGVKGVGATTGTVYQNECEANLTREYAATDVIKTTFAFFEEKEGSFRFSKTGLLTLSLTFDPKTMTISKSAAKIGAPRALGAAS